ncbi:MAG: NAD(P)H-hydrate dehydratase [Elusimicrobia bacterium]|nr:NAD(P)H-hydrate dehydratase [Elusimicrobiota bacterium]
MTGTKEALIRRRPGDHKGVFGHVLIVAGSRGMAGAAGLAAQSALRSGAGLVTLAVPEGLQAGLAPRVLGAMTLGLPENAEGTLKPEAAGVMAEFCARKRLAVMLIGPGISLHPDTARFLLLALEKIRLPAVLDADALGLLAVQEAPGVRELLRRRGSPYVFTPHPGEMARCLGRGTEDVSRDRGKSARALVRRWGGVVVLKGRGTLITDGVKVHRNPTGGPGLAKGGSGDVLAGLIAGLWAQSLASGRFAEKGPFWPAALGCWLHGRAGDLAEKDLSAWAMTAEDVISYLPQAFRDLAKKEQSK